MTSYLRTLKVYPIAIGLCWSMAVFAETSPVIVSMQQRTSVCDTEIVRIGDVAKVQGGAPVQRRKVASLDLAAHTSPDVCVISRRQVELRILLAGFNREDFQLTGPESVTLGNQEADTLLPKIEESIATEIAKQFLLEKSDVKSRVLDHRQLLTLRSKLAGMKFETTVVTGAELPVGRTRLHVELTAENGDRIVADLDTQVVVSMPVALTTQSINRGETIRQEMFRVVKRPMVERKSIASPEHLVGRTARQTINRNDVILANQLHQSTQRRSFDIKQNDLLDVVIMVGRSQVRLKNAKALKSGNRGETIAVMNTLSGKRFNAKIVDEKVAEVQLLSRVKR